MLIYNNWKTKDLIETLKSEIGAIRSLIERRLKVDYGPNWMIIKLKTKVKEVRASED
jgi:hypothetical protein